MRRWVVLVAPLLLAGCFDQLLDQHSDTQVAFMCSMLNAAKHPDVTIHSWGEGYGARMEFLAQELAEVTGRESWSIAADLGRVEPTTEWLEDNIFWADKRINLHILWQETLPDHATGLVLAPGILALNETAIAAATERLGVHRSFVEEGLLVHYVGHALGLVNQGAPVLSTDIAAREGVPGHSSNPDHIMHDAWHRGDTIAEAYPAHFSQADLDDWQATMQYVC